jgi:hypothetical protein
MTPSDTTFNVIASYYHDEWKKMVPSHEYEGFETLALAMEQAEFHQAKGFDVQVYKCEPVEIVRLTGLDEEVDEEVDEGEYSSDWTDEDEYWTEGEYMEWEDIHYDDFVWNDDEYDTRKEGGEL